MIKSILILISVIISMTAVAHKGEHHPNPSHAKMVHPVGKTEKDNFALINERYLNEVKPIFQKSCFDCHSSQARYPWYYKIPGIHQMIDSDINEAREHLNFESDFPFKSHAMPLEDLKAIADEVEENEMPPLGYRLLHAGAGLTDKEKEIIKNWVQFSLQTLNK